MMHRRHFARLLAQPFPLVATLLLSSCATWSTVSHSPELSPDIRPGEVYRIDRHVEDPVDLRILEVRGDTLFGSLRFAADSTLAVRRTEIRRLRRFEANDGRSIGLVAGTLGLLTLVVVAVSGGLPLWGS